jgi:hypothetical protein
MRHWLSVALACPFLLFAGCGDEENGGGSSDGGPLFVVTAASGSITPTGQDTLRISFENPRDPVVAFTDRPNRLAGSVSLETLVAEWDSTIFPDSPPNAAIEVAGPVSQDVLAVELSNPRLGSGQLQFDGRVLEGQKLPESLRAAFADRVDPELPPPLTNPAAFIDSGDSQIDFFKVVYRRHTNFGTDSDGDSP